MSRMLRVNVPVRAPPQAQDSEATEAGCVPRWCRRDSDLEGCDLRSQARHSLVAGPSASHLISPGREGH